MKLIINPRKFASEQEYRNRLFDKIANREDNRPDFYVGDKAIPTIGPGIELIVQSKGRNKLTRFAPRGRRQIDEYLTAAYGREFKLSDADWRRFNNAADKLNLLNKQGISDEVRKQAVKAAMDGHGIQDLPGAERRIAAGWQTRDKRCGRDCKTESARQARHHPRAGLHGQGHHPGGRSGGTYPAEIPICDHRKGSGIHDRPRRLLADRRPASPGRPVASQDQGVFREPQGGRAFTPRAEPRPLAISHEVPLSYGREVVADGLADKAANSNIPDAVRGLQTSLNKRGYGNPTQVLPHLREDGEFGPRTLARLDEELLRAGPTPVLRELNGLSVT